MQAACGIQKLLHHKFDPITRKATINRTKVIEVYGEELANFLFYIQPIHGTWWEVLRVCLMHRS